MAALLMVTGLLMCGGCSATHLPEHMAAFMEDFGLEVGGELEVTRDAASVDAGMLVPGAAAPPSICHNVHCMHGATCVVTGGDFRCDCRPRYSGQFCQIEEVPHTFGQRAMHERMEPAGSDKDIATPNDTKLSSFDSYLLRMLQLQSEQLATTNLRLHELTDKAEDRDARMGELEQDIQDIKTDHGSSGFSKSSTTAELGPLIVGGENSPITDYPWQVAVLYDGTFICGGTIISKRWIVTAAHCVYNRNRKLLEVIVGSSSIKTWGYSPKDRIGINGYMMHRSYSGRSSQWRHDLALVQLSQPMNLELVSGRTRSIPVARQGELFAGQTCTISGYGRISSITGPLPDILQAAEVPVVSNAECEKVLKNNDLITGTIVIHDEQMCAGAVKGGKGICSGDSGGPLSCRRSDGSWVLAGIVSSGFGCAREETYGVFTRMSVYSGAVQAVLKYYGE